MAPAYQRSGVRGARLHSTKPAEEAQRPQPRVLRIGVVEAGRIVDEKLIGNGQDVSVGPSERNDFIIVSDRLPSQFRMFEHRAGRYYLCFTDEMDGRLSFPGGFSELSVLRSSGRVKREGRCWMLQLDVDARGMVRLGEATVLFQMVRPPAAQLRPQLPAAVRSGWLRRVDWFFGGLLLASFVLQFGVVAWLVQSDWPVRPSFDGFSDNIFVRLAYETRPSQLDVDRLRQRLDQTGDVEAPAVSVVDPQAFPLDLPRAPRPSRPSVGPSKSAAELQGESRDRVKAALDQVARSVPGQIAILGSLNQSGDGAISDVLRGGGVVPDQDEVMAQISGVQIASVERGSVLRRPLGGDGTGRPRAADVGSLRLDGADRGVVSEAVGVEAAPRSKVQRGPLIASTTSQGSLDSGAVRRVVGESLGGIKACYERSLRRNGSLAGRVTISFTIAEGGRVVRASAVEDTLGAPEVGSCIETRFRAMRFPAPQGGPVTFQHPFIFSPANQ